MNDPAPKPSPDGCAAQTPIEDLERAALAHYDELSSKACHWNSIIPQAIRFYFDAQRRPNPETQAVASLPKEVEDFKEYPFAWHFGNIKTFIETTHCLGKLHGCATCQGSSFCTQRDALKRYATLEKCWDALYRSPVESVPPQQSAEPVGELIRRDGIVSFHTLVPLEQLQPGKVFYVPASPGPSVAVADLQKLESEFRATAESIDGTASAAGVLACADRLSALIQRHRGKS